MKQKILSTQNKRKDSHSGSVFGQYKEILLSKLDKQTGKQKVSVENQIQELIELSIEQMKGIKEHSFTIDDLFSDSTWQCECHQQYLCQLQNLHSQQFNLLILNLMIADGYFDQKFENQQTQVVQQAAPRPLSNLFILKCNEISLSILFEVGIHKNHIIEGYEQLVGFEMNHKITFIDIRNDSQQSQLVNTAQQYVKQIQRNPYRSDLPLIRQEQVIIPQIKQSAYLDSLLYKFEDQSWGQLVFGEPGKVKRWIPYEFPKFRLKQKQIEKFQWEDNKFILQEWLNIKSMNKNFIKCNQINKALFQRYADFKSASKIIDFLHTHTQFKTKLSIQERELIEETGNIMVIGRSGTGKTTCAILRLFSMQLLLKYRVKITGQKIKIFKHSQNENKNIGLHCLFTAQNQMLVDEVKQQYRKFLLELKPQNLDRSMTQTETESESDFENFNRNELQNLLFNQDQQVDQQNEREDLTARQRELRQQSLLQFNDSDFPIFLSIKELILLFDNCLNQPYLQNERFLVEENQNDHAGWQVGETHQIKIYLDDGRFKIVRIIEVDYQYFKTIFWPTIQNQLKKQYNTESYKNLIWTQIYSYIKGSEFSHQYLDQGLPFQVFYNNFNQMLTLQQAQEIYDIYLTYEKWKDKQGIFDRMDIVNYQINCVERFQFNSNPIHYTMIDEIQDLPHATIKLISKLTEQNLYCSGDTAQNIQKGVGFRFQDLRSLLVSDDKFSDIVNEKVKLHQLTINFRSHDQILKLANNVVSLIETLFPKTIDKLKKELSEKQGPKPFIVKSNNFQTLIQLLKPQNLQNQNQQQMEQINLMGAEKVIIVRSNNDKKKINQIIDNILVLTVHEAKGLEFNDVILFNFFMEEEIQLEQWQLLQHLKFDNGKIQLDPKFTYQQNNYGPLCLELKQLYVCLTRAKYRIIIFDEFTAKRQIIENIWYQQELVQDFQEQNLYQNQMQPNQRDKQLEELQRQGWREKGKKLFDVKNYNEAMKCFRFSGDINLENQCKAFHIATQTQQELNTITAKFKSKATFPKVEQEKIASEYKRIQTKSLEDFRFAASVFQNINCHIQAAQCFFSGQMYQQATIEYLMDNQYLGAADSSFEGKLYQLAGVLYLKSNYFEKSILAFEKAQDYFVILLILNQNKTYYISDEFQFKLHKYIPLFLEQVFDKFQNHRFEADFNQINQYLANKKKELQNEIELIELIRYPQNEDELIDCIWHCLKLNSHFIIKKLEISIMNYECQMAQMLFETNFTDEFTTNHKMLITDVIGYYGLYDLLEFLNLTFQLISKETQRNMFYQTVFKYSQYIECNTRQKISDSKDKNFGQYYKKFIHSQDSREQKQYFGILYLFGFQKQMNNFLNELTQIRYNEYKELSELVQFRTFKSYQLNIKELISSIEQYMSNWNKQNYVEGFYQIITTILELFNKKEQQSFLLNINNHGFQQIVLFLSFTANILKYNQNLNIQLQLFDALCAYYSLIVPHNKCMQFISQSYIIISKKSELFSQQIETESQNIGEEIFLAPTNLIVKQIRKIFQSLIKDSIKIFFKDEHNKIQIEQSLYQQFFQTKHRKYFKDFIIYQPISPFQVKFIFYLEKAFRLKFDQNLESIKVDNNSFLEDRFLNLISYQFLIKAVLNTVQERKLERIIKGLQLSSYQKADIELDNYFRTFLYLNESLTQKFTNEDIDDIENYKIALKYGKQLYFDFYYLDYLLLSYKNNTFKSTLKRDFRISFVYILNLLFIMQQQDQIKDQVIDVTYKVDELLHDNLIKKFLQVSKKQEQHGQRCILVNNQLNQQELMNIFTNWLKWYFNNFVILGNKYIFLLYENCDKEMRNVLIENIEQSQSLSKQEKDKLLIEGKSEKADKINDYSYLIKYIIINPAQEKFQPKIQITSIEKAYFSIQIYEIRSASTVLTSLSFYQQITSINQNIYYNQFNKCYNQIEMMRKKIFIYIFKICNNPIKFRSAMKLLMDLKDFQYDLYYNLEDNYDGGQEYFYNDFDDRGLLKQLEYVDKQIIEWQLKNDKFQAQINQLQIQNQNDISNIKLWRKSDLKQYIQNN